MVISYLDHTQGGPCLQILAPLAGPSLLPLLPLHSSLLRPLLPVLALVLVGCRIALRHTSFQRARRALLGQSAILNFLAALNLARQISLRGCCRVKAGQLLK